MPARPRSRHFRHARVPLLVAMLAAALLVSPAAAPAGPGPPPTPVPPHGSPSPFPQRLETTKNVRTPPKTRASAVLLADLETGQVLYASRPGLRRPIASVTKIMTALVVLEEADLNERVRVSDVATRTSGIPGLSTLPLQAGEKRTVGELLDALLIQSANDAAVALAEHVGGSVPKFLAMMDRRAKALGMRDTKFASPNGLNDRGYSSAGDLLHLTQAAIEHEEFRRIVGTKFASVPGATSSSKPRRFQNRNVLLWLYKGATGVKTGFTSRAGYCIVATAERDGRQLVVIVLGDAVPTFDDAAELLNYGFGGFKHVVALEKGEVAGTRDIDGVKVEITAGEELAGWVPRSTKGQPKTTITLFDIKPSSADVGEINASVGRTRLGPVPAVGSPLVTGIENPSTDRPAVDPYTALPPAMRREIGAAVRDSLLDLMAGRSAA